MHTGHNFKSSLIKGMGFITSAIILAIIFSNVSERRLKEGRFISVKGLAEWEVDADIGIWDIKFNMTADSLNEINKAITTQSNIIVAFLNKKGFSKENIIYGVPQIEDRLRYGRRPDEVGSRYNCEMSITLRSHDVALVYATLQQSSELVANGVVLVRDWDRNTKFLFTSLNKIKPAMIKEATINAKKAAAQFEHDAHIQVGAIRNATQGTFSIEKTYMPTKKKVRVVTTMQYYIQ